jgi:hypothetical protein
MMFSYIFSDVSFLVFSPSLQSYVFVHLLFEFSETGAVSVWDDFQSFSGRYSKQFDFSERMTTLRISQYSTLDPNISTVCWYCFDAVNRYDNCMTRTANNDAVKCFCIVSCLWIVGWWVSCAVTHATRLMSCLGSGCPHTVLLCLKSLLLLAGR